MAALRFISKTVLAALFACLMLTSGGPARAQSLFERLVMPGDLIEGHQKLEKECDNCHVSFTQGAQSSLCSGCHKDIAADVAAGTGFHGKSEEVSAQECRHCHTDHIGRDGDIVRFDRETFDHSVTDFTLRGAHRLAPCSGCHAQPALFRETPGRCIDCHRDDEPHKSRLGEACADCHTETAWRPIRGFDHDTTSFRLTGQHDKLACAACHEREVYTGLPKTCVGCHRIQDVHRGRLGPKCETCHSPDRWTGVRFNHDIDTDFALRGQHAEVACNKCHLDPDPAAKVPTDCFGCHADDDPHKAQLGRDCDTCHKADGWRVAVSFDHDITRFPLIGLHVLAPCEACHLDTAFLTASTECRGCHAADDAHDGALGADCASCHNPNGWAFWSFDHNRQTRFDLVGAHDGLQCRSCHTSPASAVLAPVLAPVRTCVECHERDDVHRGRYGTDCSRCHDEENFKRAVLR